ncbi:hypothetical protein [Sphingomonas sp. BK235]|uniref:hypothetical protein n=1 Tax=Sphingomonas sp. BK235 TaxID=2512131 RepID=UPI001044D86C|nr:hypothetical protein [Sphingomonas sp. BK235]TCP30679.1 hypothetical protein EV292_11236 [Sphingomonas sp. BK235]
MAPVEPTRGAAMSREAQMTQAAANDVYMPCVDGPLRGNLVLVRSNAVVVDLHVVDDQGWSIGRAATSAAGLKAVRYFVSRRDVGRPVLKTG